MLMIFFQVRTVSMNGCFHSGFCTLLARLTWHYVHTGIFLIEIPSNSESVQKGTCLLGIMSTLDFVYLDSVHVEVCPLKICQLWFLSTIGSVQSGFAHFWFCLISNLSNWDFVYFDSVHSKVCSHDELLTKDCVHS